MIKAMKKILKIFIISLLIILLLLVGAVIIIPIVFKPQLLKLAKTEINKNVNARVEFSDFNVSIIKGFPDVYIGLKGLSVIGVDEFEGKTLVSFDEFSLTVNLKSVIRMENIQVKSILLVNPVMTAIITPEGQVNWDITKPSQEETPAEVAADEEPMAIKAALEKFEVRNGNISYIDFESDMKATIDNLNFILNGDMSLDQSDLEIDATASKFNFFMDGIRYVKDAPVKFKSTIGVNLSSDTYSFKDNLFTINDINLTFAGEIRMPTDDIDVDITFSSTRADFKSVLSMVPAIYMTDFEGLQATGNLRLSGWAKGSVTETAVPSVAMDLVVENARFQYPDLPKSVDNISINSRIYYDGVDDDKTTVDVSKFHLEMAGNPFDITLSIRTPMSDMFVAGKLIGIIDFGNLADIIPLEDMSITGVLESNLEFGGLMSYIDNEQYDKFKADGSLKLRNFEFKSPDLPQSLKIWETSLNFSPKYVQLASFDARIGKSDMQLDGRLENFIPYVFKDETLKGNLNFRSNLLDINELMGETVEETPEVQDTVPMSVIEIPKNIDFVLTSNIKTVKYDKMDINNIIGKIIVTDGKVVMENVGMNLLKGSMNLTGEYNTQNMEEPKVDFGMDIRNFDIPTAFNSFGMLEKIAPQIKNVTGNVSTKFTLTSILDSIMEPDLNTVNGNGLLTCKNIALVGSPLFSTVADLLKNDDFRNPRLKNFDVKVEVKEGRIYIEPFDTELAGVKMNFGGNMGIDQTIDYKIKLEMPRSKLGPASQALESAHAFAAASGITLKQSDNVNLNLKVTGSATSPQVRLDMADATQGVKDQVVEQIKEIIDDKVDEAKEEAKRRAKEQADKLIKDAEKQAETVRAEAKKAADLIRKEANANAKKVEDEAKGKGIIAEKAAKVAADKIRADGEKAAKKVIDEADAKAKSIIDKAKVEAAKLESSAN